MKRVATYRIISGDRHRVKRDTDKNAGLPYSKLTADTRKYHFLNFWGRMFYRITVPLCAIEKKHPAAVTSEFK